MKIENLQSQLEQVQTLEDVQKLDRTITGVRALIIHDITMLIEQQNMWEQIDHTMPIKQKELAIMNEFQVKVNNIFNEKYAEKNGYL